MATKRTQVLLDDAHKERLEMLQKLYEKKKRQPPSLAQLANRAISHAIHIVHDEVLAELK